MALPATGAVSEPWMVCLVDRQFSVTSGLLWRLAAARTDTASTSWCPLCTAARARFGSPPSAVAAPRSTTTSSRSGSTSLRSEG